MLYVLDTSALIDMFEHYYLSRFPSLWRLFDSMIASGKLVSARESLHEIKSYWDKSSRLVRWATLNPGFFEQPTQDEARLVAAIFAVPHFQQLIDKKKVIGGGYVADPFIVAKAKIRNGIVVCQERLRQHAAKIPNVCRHFGVECVDIEGFMEKESWFF